jgi:hypothetical protein
MWIASHKMPPAIPGTRKWDRRAIDAKLDEISGLGDVSPIDRRSDLKKWRDEDKADRPRHGLDAKAENILVAMSYNTELDTLDQLPGAGPVLMGRLIVKKLVICEKAGKEVRYKITDEGHSEAVRIFESWRR